MLDGRYLWTGSIGKDAHMHQPLLHPGSITAANSCQYCRQHGVGGAVVLPCRGNLGFLDLGIQHVALLRHTGSRGTIQMSMCSDF